MPVCECNCGKELTGRAERFASDECRARFWTNARRVGAGKMQAVLAQATSTDTTPVSILKKRKGMHVGSLETSKAQKAILARLEQGPASTWVLHEYSGSMSVATDVSALNKNLLGSGRQVMCKYKGISEEKRKVYIYSLVTV